MYSHVQILLKESSKKLADISFQKWLMIFNFSWFFNQKIISRWSSFIPFDMFPIFFESTLGFAAILHHFQKLQNFDVQLDFFPWCIFLEQIETSATNQKLAIDSTTARCKRYLKKTVKKPHQINLKEWY